MVGRLSSKSLLHFSQSLFGSDGIFLSRVFHAFFLFSTGKYRPSKVRYQFKRAKKDSIKQLNYSVRIQCKKYEKEPRKYDQERIKYDQELE
jgi:hypothetical protein